MTRPVQVTYRRNVAEVPGERRAFIKGETFVMESAADAKRMHPAATIEGYYEGGQVVEPYVEPKSEPAKAPKPKRSRSTKTVTASSATPATTDAAPPNDTSALPHGENTPPDGDS